MTPAGVHVPAPDAIAVAARPHPLKSASEVRDVPAGLSLAEILDIVQPDPVLAAHAHIEVRGHYVPREHWHRVWPKPGTHVAIRVVPAGGGGGGKKNPLRTILTIAVIAASVYVPGAALANPNAIAFAGITYGKLLGAGIPIVGGILIADRPPPMAPA